MLKKLCSFFVALVLLLQLVPFGFAARTEIGQTEGTESFSGTHSASTDLLFDFSNNSAAQTRYASSAYGKHNFDQETNGFWRPVITAPLPTTPFPTPTVRSALR